jgi:hypothetical protein
LSLTRGYFLVVPLFEICENAGKLGSREHKMGEYSDRVRADIVSDNRARRILYLVYGAIAVAAVCLLGGFATIVLVLGLGPVLALIVVIEIYSRIQNWRRLRAAEDADADLGKLRPEKSTDRLAARRHDDRAAGSRTIATAKPPICAGFSAVPSGLPAWLAASSASLR